MIKKGQRITIEQQGDGMWTARKGKKLFTLKYGAYGFRNFNYKWINERDLTMDHIMAWHDLEALGKIIMENL